MQTIHEPRPSDLSGGLRDWRARASAWFLRSGIQAPGGGVSRYYRGDSGLRLADSTEITAYAIGGLLSLGLPEEAERAAGFLLDRAWDPKLEIFPYQIYTDTGAAYFFDSGIIVRALLHLHRETGDAQYREAAEAGGKSMARHFQAPQGYHPILRLPDLSPETYTQWWSRRPGCFHLKAALAWCELDGVAEPNYQRQLSFSLDTVDELLGIETEPLKVMDRLHPYCYFLEGLMPVARDHEDVMRRGIDSIGANLRHLAPRFSRSDVYAQLLRVRLLAESLAVVPLDSIAAAEEAAELAAMQIESHDPALDGSFAFGQRDGETILHANPVSTTFAVQALDWWQDRQAGCFSGTWQQLI